MGACEIVFLILGATGTVFYGACANNIFCWPRTDAKQQPYPEGPHKKSWHIHQWWINGLGAAVGWASLYYVLCQRILCGATMGIFDIFVAALGIAGVMGFLPNIASRLKS